MTLAEIHQQFGLSLLKVRLILIILMVVLRADYMIILILMMTVLSSELILIPMMLILIAMHCNHAGSDVAASAG